MQMDVREHSRKMKAMNVRESKTKGRVSGSGGSDDDDDDDWGIRVEALLHFSCKMSFYSCALRMYTELLMSNKTRTLNQ